MGKCISTRAPITYVCLIQINSDTGGIWGIGTTVGQSVFMNIFKHFPQNFQELVVVVSSAWDLPPC